MYLIWNKKNFLVSAETKMIQFSQASKGAHTVQELCKFSQQYQVKQINTKDNTKDNKKSNPHELLTINTSTRLT